MLPLLVLLFVTVPLAELALLLWLGGRIGVGPTVAIVLATGLVGAVVARRQGTAAMREIVDAARRGRTPEREIAAGALFLAGAAFLLTPGIVTDVAGFLLMVPAVRRRAAGHLVSRLGERATVVHVDVRGGGGPGGPGAGPAARGPRRVDAEAEVRGGDGDGED